MDHVPTSVSTGGPCHLAKGRAGGNGLQAGRAGEGMISIKIPVRSVWRVPFWIPYQMGEPVAARCSG